ncbi:MAG: 50S ribosomal protein L1 [Actinobacteria bacterium RBG_16_67_15]|nr:MAG: 50S ribosomal protein L1 [Actinobacteria bacterium RBG_16_67_15]
MSKKRDDAGKKFDGEASFAPIKALGLVKSSATAKFDETVEATFNLGIDPKQADQGVRGTVALPHGTGKKVKVLVFAEGEAARAAEANGADKVGGADLAAAITSGAQPLDWDITIAHPSLMAEVGKLGKALGPRGLMPNPKAGTVTPDVGKAVKEFKGGRVEYRNDRFGNIAVGIGKVSFSAEQLRDNLSILVGEITRVKPSSSKGRYIKKLTLSSTMGLGIHVDVNELDELKNE